MIRYDTGITDLKQLIKAENLAWLDDAKVLTDGFRQADDYFDHRTIWRKIVSVYMRIQHNKCAFCERKLEAEATGGKREFDVEHFRPKSSVKKWPPNKLRDALPENFPDSEGSTKGYFLLPYHPYNYTVACKPCNSSFKSNFFPIAGIRYIQGDNPREMEDEEPYLVYPIGDFDSNPESIIVYDGVMAVPRFKTGARNRRGVVTIVFFGLNVRDELFLERAQKLAGLYLALTNQGADAPVMKTTARAVIQSFTSANSSHTNCMRSFKRLFDSDRPRSDAIIQGVIELLESSS